jgi:hypothetical protein
MATVRRRTRSARRRIVSVNFGGKCRPSSEEIGSFLL